MRDATQVGADADRAYFMAAPDRSTRARPASADEIRQALSFCLFRAPTSRHWHAFVRVLSRSPLTIATVYMRGECWLSSEDHGESWAAHQYDNMQGRAAETYDEHDSLKVARA